MVSATETENREEGAGSVCVWDTHLSTLVKEALAQMGTFQGKLEEGKGTTRHENIWGKAFLAEGTASSGGWIIPGAFKQQPGWRLKGSGKAADWGEMRLVREWGCCVVLGIVALSRPDSQPEGLERK